VKWGKVDTDREQELASAFGIRSIPTLMIFRDGVLVFQRPGLIPASALDALVAEVQALDMADVKNSSGQPERKRAAG
jgi:thioredoxin 1